jgi:signal transduction histidine kinase
MAIKPMPKQIREFLPRFNKRIVTMVVLMNLLIVLIVAAILIYTHVFNISSIELWSIIAGLAFISIVSSLFSISTASGPTKDLLTAITHISGEPTDKPFPSPTDKKYAGTGFQSALQTLYELSGTHTQLDTSVAPVKTVESVMDTALEQTTSGFVVLNHERKIIYSNKSAPVHTSPTGDKTLQLFFNGSDTLDAWLNTCEEESVHAEHVWTRIADKLPEEEERHLFDVIASYNKGAISETVVTLIDRTNIYNVNEQELDFIAFAAHELRGPITVIRGYLDVLEDELDGVLQDDQHELFRRLTVSANRLSGYINNILNTSRYDRRHLSVHLNEETVAGIYNVIADDMMLRAKAQNRLLSVAIPADLPTVAADTASMSEVFGNLIDNAIKYSNEGGAINVTAAVKNDFVEVSIEDHGIGMPGNVVSNLFQKFYRSHRSRETVAGTGIGLYISKAIVESHGGTIGVTSEEGRGSTFTVQIPIYATVADKLQASDNSNKGLIENGDGWIKNHSMYRG